MREYDIDRLALLALAETEVPATRGHDLWEHFGNGQNLFDTIATDDFAKRKLGALYQNAVEKITFDNLLQVVKRLDERGVSFCTLLDDDFPVKLRDMLSPPYLVYYRGDLSLCDTDCVSVVGTRRYTGYGEAVAKNFSKVLARSFTIVSGLAYGIDSIAHRTALDNDGKTIAVLGSSVADVYPGTNQSLAERIVNEGGLLLSEYGLDSTPQSFHFPDRNRIVAALGKGTLVCESPSKSGTLLTAHNAVDEGHEVFAVPGDIFLKTMRGSNDLIKSGQAICVTDPSDILSYYGKDSNPIAVSVQLDFNEQAVVDILQNGQTTFDNLVQLTHIPPSELNFLLANLEIKSIISKLPGNSYRLVV